MQARESNGKETAWLMKNNISEFENVFGSKKIFLQYLCCCFSIPLGSPAGKKVPQQLFLLRVLSELTRRTLRRKSCFRTFFPLGEPRGMLQQQQKYFRKFFSAPQTFFSVRNIFIEAIS